MLAIILEYCSCVYTPLDVTCREVMEAMNSADLVKAMKKFKEITGSEIKFILCFASQGRTLDPQPGLFVLIKFTRQVIYCV